MSACRIDFPAQPRALGYANRPCSFPTLFEPIEILAVHPSERADEAEYGCDCVDVGHSWSSLSRLSSGVASNDIQRQPSTRAPVSSPPGFILFSQCYLRLKRCYRTTTECVRGYRCCRCVSVIFSRTMDERICPTITTWFLAVRCLQPIASRAWVNRSVSL